MAVIKVDRAKVERVFQQGRAMQIVETVNVKGNDIPQRYTVWFDQTHGKNEGDYVGVTGELTHRPGSFQMNGELIHTSEANINKPQLFEPQVTHVQSTLDVLENAPF